jgi:HemK-like putative methylase
MCTDDGDGEWRVDDGPDRWETEAYTEALAAALRRGIPAAAAAASKLRILDLCTGTGCIALLLHALLAPRFPALEILGIDVSRAALGLARKNLHWNVGRGVLSRRAETQVRFVEGDVLRMAAGAGMEDVLGGGWDVVVSNPPYISPRGYERETEQSVRRFEPRLALVPERKGEGNRDEDVGDAFYGPLLAIARRVEAKVLLMEVAGGGQAQRLVELIGKESKEHWGGWEIWRDGICDDDLRMVSNGAGMGSAGSHVLHGQVQSQVRAVGSGGPRSIICWHGIGTEWLRRIDTS